MKACRSAEVIAQSAMSTSSTDLIQEQQDSAVIAGPRPLQTFALRHLT